MLDPWVLAFTTACVVAGCTSPTIGVIPGEISDDEWSGRELEVRGLTPPAYLDASGDGVRAARDLTVDLVAGETRLDTEIVRIGPAGPVLRLTSRPAVGTFDLVVRAHEKRYRQERAFRVSHRSDGDGDADADSDGGGDGDADQDLDVDADAEDVTCVEGASACVGDDLFRCVGGEMVLEELCPLGCASGESRCFVLDPSNVPGAFLHPSVALVEELVLSEDLVFDTDTGRIVTGGGTEVRAAGTGPIAGIDFETDDGSCLGVGVFTTAGLQVVAGTVLSGRGTRGLVLLVEGDAVVDGRIVCSATGLEPGPGGYRGGARGEDGFGPGGGLAGMYYTDCCDSGGGGGGHGGAGGTGGSAGGAEGGVGGGAWGSPSLVPLCGGSGGGGLWGPTWPTRGSEGGAGGGAVQLSATRSVSVGRDGLVLAGGGGATGGHPSGGGGGGSGGALLIEAPVVAISGHLGAAGGGGGSGGHDPYGNAGTDGDLGGAGGPATAQGAAGGDGATGADSAGGDGGSHSNNGGGAGGGPGRVRINTADGLYLHDGTSSPERISSGIVSRL